MDIQHIIDTAKEILLKRGDHPPMLFVEMKSNAIQPYVTEFIGDEKNCTKDKQYALFGVGREHGINHPGNPIQSVVLVSEAWLSITRGEKKPKYTIPHEDPNKKEVLIIVQLDMSTGKSTQTTVEMLRDGSGQLMDLLRMPMKDYEIYDNLLPYFVAGSASASMSDAELARKLTGR